MEIIPPLTKSMMTRHWPLIHSLSDILIPLIIQFSITMTTINSLNNETLEEFCMGKVGYNLVQGLQRPTGLRHDTRVTICLPYPDDPDDAKVPVMFDDQGVMCAQCSPREYTYLTHVGFVDGVNNRF